MHTDSVGSLEFETGAFQLIHNESQRCAGVCAGEDVLVHEETPDQILVLPRFAQTGDLQEEDTVIIEHIVDIRQKGREVTDTDVLGHFETCDLLIPAGNDRGITVVHAQNAALGFVDATLPERIVSPGGLVAAESDTGNVSSVVDAGVFRESAPAAAKVENGVTGLQANLFAHNRELVILELLEGLFLVDIADEAGGVDHARAEEPCVEIVTTVVVTPDLFLV